MSKLVLVPTPIGNLEDITLRALNVLKQVDFILAEDTRQTSKLLKHYEIDKKLVAHHQHNEHKTLEKVINAIKNGENVALVSDAGTPAISDPGFLLVRECLKNNIVIETLPGATAFVPALINSGLPCDKFVFEGFLPHKKGRQTRLKFLQSETRTLVFYESPHRLLKTLNQFCEYFGENRQATVSRELTKIHEETITGTIQEVKTHFEKQPPRGEFVIVMAGKKKNGL